jgi:hypothetical protein
MSFTTYILLSVIAYLGLVAGFILTLISPEELKAGEKYAHFGRSVFYIASLLLTLYLKVPSIGIIVLIAIAMHIYLAKDYNSVKIEYGILGVIMGMLLKEIIILAISASLIFLFGISVAICCIAKHEKKSRKWQLYYILGTNALFFVTAIPVYFLDILNMI